MKMKSQKIIKLKNGKIITTEELIEAAEKSLKKWDKIKEWETNIKCGFCNLMQSKGIYVSMSSVRQYPETSPCFIPCPAGRICHVNIKFWDEILLNDRKKFNPDKFKYQKQRIQKNIDWIKAYLKELKQ